MGGGQDLLNNLLKEYNCDRRSDRLDRRPDGRLVPQGDQVDGRSQGLKFRVGGFAGTIIAKVGGVPQQIAGGDIYPALEKGTIDAAEWVGLYDDEKLGFVKVAKYYYYPGWWEGTGQGHNIMNLDKWNALPKHYQAALETASRDTFTWVTGKYDYVNPPALKRLLVAGAILGRSRRRCWRPATAPRTRSTRISARPTRTSTRCTRACSAFRERIARLDAGRRAQLSTAS